MICGLQTTSHPVTSFKCLSSIPHHNNMSSWSPARQSYSTVNELQHRPVITWCVWRNTINTQVPLWERRAFAPLMAGVKRADVHWVLQGHLPVFCEACTSTLLMNSRLFCLALTNALYAVIIMHYENSERINTLCRPQQASSKDSGIKLIDNAPLGLNGKRVSLCCNLAHLVVFSGTQSNLARRIAL